MDTFVNEIEHTVESGKMNDFIFPSFWTSEEETYIEEVIKVFEQEMQESNVKN